MSAVERRAGQRWSFLERPNRPDGARWEAVLKRRCPCDDDGWFIEGSGFIRDENFHNWDARLISDAPAAAEPVSTLQGLVNILSAGGLISQSRPGGAAPPRPTCPRKAWDHPCVQEAGHEGLCIGGPIYATAITHAPPIAERVPPKQIPVCEDCELTDVPGIAFRYVSRSDDPVRLCDPCYLDREESLATHMKGTVGDRLADEALIAATWRAPDLFARPWLYRGRGR
jgi:hypothetical protein